MPCLDHRLTLPPESNELLRSTDACVFDDAECADDAVRGRCCSSCPRDNDAESAVGGGVRNALPFGWRMSSVSLTRLTSEGENEWDMRSGWVRGPRGGPLAVHARRRGGGWSEGAPNVCSLFSCGEPAGVVLPFPLLLNVIFVSGVHSVISRSGSSMIFLCIEVGFWDSWNVDMSGVEGADGIVDIAGDAGDKGRSRSRSCADPFCRSMLRRLVPARPKLSSGCVSDPSSVCVEGDIDAADGERGRAPAPEKSPRMAETVVDGLRGGALLERREDVEPERLRAWSGDEGPTGDCEGRIPCARMDSITSRSPRGSTAPFCAGFIAPSPARIDLPNEVI